MKAAMPRATLSALKIKLPSPRTDSAISLEQTLRHRRSVREFTNEPLELWQLAQLLWAAQGITDPEGLRSAPSAGGLYPLELYAVAGSVTGLTPGIYSYEPHDHELTIVLQGDKRRDLCAAALSQASVQASGCQRPAGNYPLFRRAGLIRLRRKVKARHRGC